MHHQLHPGCTQGERIPMAGCHHWSTHHGPGPDACHDFLCWHPVGTHSIMRIMPPTWAYSTSGNQFFKAAHGLAIPGASNMAIPGDTWVPPAAASGYLYDSNHVPNTWALAEHFLGNRLCCFWVSLRSRQGFRISKKSPMKFDGLKKFASYVFHRAWWYMGPWEIRGPPIGWDAPSPLEADSVFPRRQSQINMTLDGSSK